MCFKSRKKQLDDELDLQSEKIYFLEILIVKIFA